METTPRPQTSYRQALLDQLLSQGPASVLEVGCGGGGFLRSAAQLDTALIGIDPDPEALDALRAEGFEVHLGSAEQLDFADASQDHVVFSYSAHHIADWPLALTEALRVARLGVVILDPWYDPGIASQKVALNFDRWCKSIDREYGMVHNDCLSAANLLEPIADQMEAYRIKVHYHLILHPLDPDCLTDMAAEQLDKCGHDQGRLQEFESIKTAARRQGLSDDGAILLSITKR